MNRYMLFCLLMIGAWVVKAQGPSLEKAEALIEAGKNEEAGPLLNDLRTSEDLEVRAGALRLTGVMMIKSDELDSAQWYLNQALQLSRETYLREEMMVSLHQLGRVQVFKGNFGKAQAYGEEARNLALELNDLEAEASINGLLGWSYYSNEVDFKTVLMLEKRQAEIVGRIDQSIRKGIVYNNLGYDLTVAGFTSLDSIIKLSKIANAIFGHIEGSKGRWYTSMNLIWQYRLKNQLDSSKYYGELAVRQGLQANDRHAVVETYFQLGVTLLTRGEREAAAQSFAQGKEWRGSENDRDGYVFDVYYADWLWEIGKKKEAMALLEEAVEFLKTSEVLYEMQGRVVLAHRYYEQGKIDKAEAQIRVIENPRHNYISFETRCLAAIIRARLLDRNAETSKAKTLLTSWLKHMESIQADALAGLLREEMEKLG